MKVTVPVASLRQLVDAAEARGQTNVTMELGAETAPPPTERSLALRRTLRQSGPRLSRKLFC
jgi:hypothetical protein